MGEVGRIAESWSDEARAAALVARRAHTHPRDLLKPGARVQISGVGRGRVHAVTAHGLEVVPENPRARVLDMAVYNTRTRAYDLPFDSLSDKELRGKLTDAARSTREAGLDLQPGSTPEETARVLAAGREKHYLPVNLPKGGRANPSGSMSEKYGYWDVKDHAGKTHYVKNSTELARRVHRGEL